MKNKSRMIIGKRIVMFIVAICMVGAGGYTRYLVDNEKSRTDLYGSKESDTKTEGNLKKADRLSKKVDYVYLQKMCTYLPEFSESKELTDDELKEIYVKAFKYFCMRYAEADSIDNLGGVISTEEYNYGERNIILPNQFVEKKRVDDTTEKWIFNGSALDKFNDIVGIKFNPEKINSKEVEYNKKKDEYVVYVSEKLENTLECYSVNTNYNEKDGSINIDVEKDDKNQDENCKVTRLNVEIVSSNNKYGYKIRKINEDYPVLKKNLNEIIKEVENSDNHINEILYYINSYQYQETEASEAIEKLIYEGGKYGSTSLKGLIRNKYINKEHQINKEGINNVAELLGIPKEKRNLTISSEKVKIKNQQYFIDYVEADEDFLQRSKEVHFIEAKKDEKNECVIMNYVALQERKGEADNYKKIKMVLKPEKSIWGYRIESIETEVWNDEYVKELKQLEKKAYEVGNESIDISNENEERENAEMECWTNEREKVLKSIGEKYPKEKKKIEKREDNWWNLIEKEAEDGYQINKNDTEDEKRNKKISILSYKSWKARERVYYLIGKYLTEDNN